MHFIVCQFCLFQFLPTEQSHSHLCKRCHSCRAHCWLSKLQLIQFSKYTVALPTTSSSEASEECQNFFGAQKPELVELPNNTLALDSLLAARRAGNNMSHRRYSCMVPTFVTAEVAWAAQNGEPARVCKWLNEGGPIDARDVFQCSLLHMAAAAGHLIVVQELIRRGASLNVCGLLPFHS